VTDLHAVREETRVAGSKRTARRGMRTPFTADDDQCWGGRNFKFKSERPASVA